MNVSRYARIFITDAAMHELLLFAQVPPARHAQLLRIISGIAGMRPQPITERHLLFKPRKPPGFGMGQVGGSQGIQTSQIQALQGQMQGELFFLQLVGEIDPGLFPPSDDPASAPSDGDTAMEDSGDGTAEETKADPNDAKEGYDFEKQAWSLRFNDLPEVAGRRPVTSRMISGVDIIEGDALDFMRAFGYR